MSIAEKEKYYLDIIEKHEANGVEFFTSHGIIIDPQVKIGKGTQILPGTILRGETEIGENCVIGENARIGKCPEEMSDIGKWGIAVVGSNLTVGEKAEVKPQTMLAENLKEGDCE